MSAQSITNAIGRITMNPTTNISISTAIIEATNNYIRTMKIKDPEKAIAIINTIISHVRQKGHNLLQQIDDKEYGSEDAKKHLQNGIIKSIDMIVGRLDTLRLKYFKRNTPVDAKFTIVIPARLAAIQTQLVDFQENQLNYEEYKEMRDEAARLIAELRDIQGTLPSTESAVFDEKTKREVRGLNRTIDQLMTALSAWRTHFTGRESKAAVAEGSVRMSDDYTTLIRDSQREDRGRREDASLEERVAALSDLSDRRGMKKEPGAKYFQGGRRKTRKRKRRRKRKTRKTHKKRRKRTRRRKPKKRHRRTRKK